ncbi:uncharacterized protein LOC130728054 [Lotus japonicus]|uniref:uncharacterized protein LOC130728054 n=1 Tax=Lotus japonicus TaxID=34305 RepID=UPI002589FADA|nr:uncharacterized protein LOC130728054 [Lotus japonicus]XP_057435369.1 uncharacterized protein LOC130728054 [Lotus japonicus]XP_057435370.1 uncharacterized protein LOC130728054 [Lotus japonicus]
MEMRLGLLFLVVLGAAWACDAKELANPFHWSINRVNSGSSGLNKIPDVCELCEEYTSKALDYIKEDKTQNEIIGILHNTCNQLRSFEQKCIALVDYYAPLFFLEIAAVQPGDFCNKVNLCQNIASTSLQVQENSCEFCKDTVSALLLKLKDPGTKLEIIETLLKVCSSVDKYASKCKKLVFEYGPFVFDNAEKFLEKTNICTALHACESSSLFSSI